MNELPNSLNAFLSSTCTVIVFTGVSFSGLSLRTIKNDRKERDLLISTDFLKWNTWEILLSLMNNKICISSLGSAFKPHKQTQRHTQHWQGPTLAAGRDARSQDQLRAQAPPHGSPPTSNTSLHKPGLITPLRQASDKSRIKCIHKGK